MAQQTRKKQRSIFSGVFAVFLALLLGLTVVGGTGVYTLISSTAHASETTDEQAPAAEADSTGDVEDAIDELSEEGDTGDDGVGDVDVEAASVWDTGLITSVVALLIAGCAALLGIWVDRDRERPIVFAMSMSLLIFTAVVVGVAQAYLDTEKTMQRQEDLARMLEMVGAIAESTGDAELSEFLDKEMENQSKSNPNVTKRVEARATARDVDPDDQAGQGE